MIQAYSFHIREIAGAVIGNFPIKALISTVLLLLEFFLGAENQLIVTALVSLILIDFTTGVAAAYKNKIEVTSRRAVKSAFKVAMYGLLVAAGHLTDVAVLNANVFDRAVVAFLAVTELISIIENVGKMGYAIPKKLLGKLQNLRDEQ